MCQQTATLRQRMTAHERKLIEEAITRFPRRKDQEAFLGLPHMTYYRKLKYHQLI